nr:nucleolar protein 16-like [Zootoca vivipara]
MPKAKGKSRRQKYNYNVDRKKQNRAFRKRAVPRIKCTQIRHAWDRTKTVKQNLAEMGLAVDQNKAIPIPKTMQQMLKMEVDGQEANVKTVRQPYVLNELESEASLPEKKSESLSQDLIDYVQHMIQSHGENYKAMARDEKNYYQDTPKQIKRKINVYKHFYPEEYQTFVASLQPEKMEQQ